MMTILTFLPSFSAPFFVFVKQLTSSSEPIEKWLDNWRETTEMRNVEYLKDFYSRIYIISNYPRRVARASGSTYKEYIILLKSSTNLWMKL